jgi:hypothetical protein
MNYLKVRWLHAHAADPVLLFSELDVDRYESRKIEVFADGRMGFAGEEGARAGTILGEQPVPPVSEIVADPQFVVEPVDEREFEAAWRTAIAGARWQLHA